MILIASIGWSLFVITLLNLLKHRVILGTCLSSLIIAGKALKYYSTPTSSGYNEKEAIKALEDIKRKLRGVLP